MRRTRKILKPVAAFVLVNMLMELCAPFAAKALTSGPSQPEYSSFEPANTTQMVDLFTGDFNYNIPLLDIEGYPLNISYHSGVTMDQEASWVGLGWNINPGVINRNMRGLPDDFKGDQVYTEFNMLNNTTWGIKTGAGIEAFGGTLGLSTTLGVFSNNYRGVGLEYSIDPSISAGYGGKSFLTLGLGLGYNSQNGFSYKENLSAQYSATLSDKLALGGSASVGISSNSRAGLQQLSFGGGTSLSTKRSENDHNKDNYGENGGSSINFSKPCFVPQITFPMNNWSYSFTAKAGGALEWCFLNGTLQGYYSTQKLAQQNKLTNSYGYMYLQNAGTSDALDFNREKEGDVSLTRPNLPVTNLTYDVYSVSGQGVGGTYRPFRSDVGTVYDPYVENGGTGFSGGAEAGLGLLLHGGLNISTSSVNSHSGKWTDNNYASDYSFGEGGCYFKQAGEKVLVSADSDIYSQRPDAYRLGLQDSGANTKLNTVIYNQDGHRPHAVASGAYTGKPKQNQVVAIQTNAETRMLTADSIPSFTPGKLPTAVVPTKLLRSHYPDHHIGEFSTLRPDGARYVYGIPVYNTKQVEATFNISKKPSNGDGTINYSSVNNSSRDDSTTNQNGIDHYYRKTYIPPYAYSYLLTEVLSQDYVDVLGDGITPDDLGTAIKFNYTKLYGHDGVKGKNYRWRTPYGLGASADSALATLDEGFKSVSNDNKASYIYGEKEIWYLHSVVTKNYVAQFYLSKREDGLGVKAQYGGQDTSQRLMKVDSIVLYSRTDLVLNGAKAVKIKGVHFQYDYSLCPGVYNNATGGGKLTLKKIYFTYGTSKKGKFSPYTFDYSSVNYSYNFTARDRWGNYKADNGSLPNREFPYVEQTDLNSVTRRSISADLNAQAWSLTTIHLPSGGSVQVDYESDDYAFVQNQPAMQMCKIIGMGSSVDDAKAHNNFLYLKKDGILGISNSYSNQDYVFVSLPYAMSEADFLSSVPQRLYFKLMAHVNSGNRPDYDYVPGFADVDRAGIVSQGGAPTSTIGWIKLSEINLDDDGDGDGTIQPMAKSVMQYAKVNFPQKVYHGSGGDDEAGGGLDFLTGIVSEVLKAADGFYPSLRSHNYADQVHLDHSWVRLYSHTGTKAGGGSRVKRIRMTDNWSGMEPAGNGTMSYGQEFSYTNAKGVSTGVASWEPAIGSDENPFTDIQVYPDEKIGAISDFHQVILPMGESFAPAPVVGYSQVKITDLKHNGDPGNGYSLHRFYTSYQFPTVFNQTPIALKHEKDEPDILESFLGTSVTEEDLIMSQGYTVMLNDMHGKPFSTEIYNNGSDLVSSVSYYYRRDATGNLYNIVPLVDRSGKVSRNEIGVDVDVVADAREHTSDIEGHDYGINLDVGIVPLPFPFPLPFPSGWPQHSAEKTMCRTAVLTRVVQQYGLIDSVVARDEHSHITTMNKAYDPETGEVLLTKTNDNFNDSVYSFTYPAHWEYDGMGPAYLNLGAKLDNVNITKGKLSSRYLYLTGGDELLLYNTAHPRRVWVYRAGNTYSVIERNGSLVDGITNASIKVVRSGRRNMSSTPIGSVTNLFVNPAYSDSLKFRYVLNAGASEYSDQWPMYICGTDKFNNACNSNQLGSIINPYVKGVKGVWHKQKDLVYMDVRNQSSPSVSTRIDGLFSSWYPFWMLSPTTTLAPNDTSRHWTWTNQVTKYSPYGFEIENKDALNNYTAALYGYNNSFPTAIASNATYSDIVFDGFEDYGGDNIGITNPAACFRSPHWNISYSFNMPGFRPAINPAPVVFSDTVSTFAHTGNRSLWIKGGFGDTVSVNLNYCTPTASTPGNFPQYIIQSTDCITGLSPQAGKYLISMWVRKDTDCTVFSYSGIQAKVTVGGGGGHSITLSPQGNIIEGWQKMEGEFSIPPGATNLWLILSKFGAGHDAYFDDIRIHPFSSNMKSFVYDPVSLRLMAELDANNYASFYEYDEEGKLNRVKKETSKGIIMINEGRMSEHSIR